MSDEAEVPQPPEVEAEVQSDPHAFTPEQQERVNNLLAKERATAARKAKQQAKAATQQTKQEPTTDAGDNPQMTELVRMVQGLAEKQAASESAVAFAADTAGLTISETDKALLKATQSSNPELYAAKLAECRAADQPPPAKGPGFTSAGAPAATTRGPDLNSIVSWTKDDIQAMKTAGTFRENLKKARKAMPGGGGGLFPAKR